jgi:ABC-type nitrate/sulfonate/bicarbonate transport system substrate-binding protein
MKNTLVLLVLFFAFAPVKLSLGNSPSEAAQDLPKTVITYGALAEREAPLHVARHQGLFRKYGLDALAVHVRGAPIGLAAIGAGESQFWYGTASGVTLGAITGGLDGVFFAGLINKLTGTFVVSPAIKSPADLKDRTIGVTSMGGGIWMYTMLALEHWKIDPKRDKVKLRVVGDQAVIAQAIASGVVDGGYLSYTYASALERQGFRILVDFSTLDIPFPSVGLYGRRSFVNQWPATLEKTLKASTEAIRFIQNPTNKVEVMKSLAKGLHLQKVEDAQEGYDKVKNMFDVPIYTNIDGMRNAIRLLAFTNEKIGRLKAEDVVDNSIVKKLEQEGFFAR